MANTSAICTSFKQDLLNGLHAFGTSVVRGTTAADTFYGSLYYASGSLGAATTAYTTSGELASGNGYTTAGEAVTNATPPTTSGTTAYWTPSASLVWTSFTATAFDTLLLYNETASGKNAVGVFNFGSQTVTSGTFTLTMPVNAASTALIQLD